MSVPVSDEERFANYRARAMTSPTETREAVARTLYEMARFGRPDDPGAAMGWDELPEWARQNNRKRADILIAGPLAPLHAEIESLRAERDAALARTKDIEGRYLGFRMQIAPVGTLAPAIGGGRWYKTERGWKWNGPDGTGGTFPGPGGDWTGELVLPGHYETEVSRLTAALAESERQGAVMRERADKAEALAKAETRNAEMYANAWVRELGGKLFRKTHHIDACVVTTRWMKERSDRLAVIEAEQKAAALISEYGPSDEMVQARAALTLKEPTHEH